MSDPHQPDPGADASSSPPPATPSRGGAPALRASDADRERIVDVLRRAAGEGRLDVDELDERLQLAYATRTVDELESLTADVRVPGAPTSQAAAGVVVSPGPGGTRFVISVMGGSDRTGRWRIAPRCFVLNIMGGSQIDLTRAELSNRMTQINVLSVMGGSEIRVPQGVDVKVSKLALLGGNDARLDDQPPPPGGPMIHVRLISFMGGSNVRQGPRRGREGRRREKELRRARRRGELND